MRMDSLEWVIFGKSFNLTFDLEKVQWINPKGIFWNSCLVGIEKLQSSVIIDPAEIIYISVRKSKVPHEVTQA